MAQKPSALGEFLRARREQVRPEDVGLVGGKRRRVAGLRREELATLAGISSAYCLRLEQGRVTNPSVQVLDALARALQVDARATQHLHDLTAPARQEMSPSTAVAHEFAQVIDEFLMPAIVVNKRRDVLAANQLALALSPEFAPGQNLIRWRLSNPAARTFYVNWDEATEVPVSALRELSGHCPLDPGMRALIADCRTPVHVSGSYGRARRWATARVCTTCAIHRSAISISAGTGSTQRISAGTTC